MWNGFRNRGHSIIVRKELRRQMWMAMVRQNYYFLLKELVWEIRQNMSIGIQKKKMLLNLNLNIQRDVIIIRTEWLRQSRFTQVLYIRMIFGRIVYFSMMKIKTSLCLQPVSRRFQKPRKIQIIFQRNMIRTGMEKCISSVRENPLNI